METSTKERQYSIKGGRTIIGYIFAYQEKTGSSYQEVLKMPWLSLVIGMMDAPSIDYDSGSKEEKEKTLKADTVEEEVANIQAIFG